MFGIGWTEILVILVVALLVLGPTKLPEIAKGLGKGIRDFKKAVNSIEDDVDPNSPRRASYQQENPPPPAPTAKAPEPVQPPEPAALPPGSPNETPSAGKAETTEKPREG